jgi:glycosyltransferase involved in cell wall biosynthesis
VSTSKPTLHLIGIFHTIHNQEYSHCAFTGKALRFPKMLQDQGWEVIEYSNEGSESAAETKVVMIPRDKFEEIRKGRLDTAFHGGDAVLGNVYHTEFEKNLNYELKQRVKAGDIICHPFGHAHAWVVTSFPQAYHVETGIGYATTVAGTFKIFESHAWRHTHIERDCHTPGRARSGANYEWVIPNYFEVDDWEVNTKVGEYVAFMGRITPEKGLNTILEIARRIDMPVAIAGQGDPTPWQHPNIIYRGPLKGKERSDFIGGALCSLMPTEFVEPFGGSGIEGMLCGTPLVASDFGAFSETVVEGLNGYRCKTLRQWLDAIENCKKLDRSLIAGNARYRYGMETCGKQYDAAFTMISDLGSGGWYKDCPILVD